MSVFDFLKIAAAAILDFRNFKFLTVGTVNGVELRVQTPGHVPKNCFFWGWGVNPLFKNPAKTRPKTKSNVDVLCHNNKEIFTRLTDVEM